MPEAKQISPPPTDAFLRAVLDSSSDALISEDLAGTITSWSRGAERIFGYSAAEAVGQQIAFLLPSDRLDEERGILARIGRGQSIDNYETVRRRKDGSLVDIALTVTPLRDASGRIVGGCTIARDVSEERREQQRLAVTLSSIGDAVISTDDKGHVVFMNAVAEKLTGWSSLDAAGQPLHNVFRIVNDTTRMPVESPVARVLRDGLVVGLANHTMLIARDGRECPIDDSAAPIRTRFGQIIGVVLVFRDCSERRAAELAMTRLAAIVEGSDDAIVSKDLNGIVTTWNPGAERIFGYTAAEMVGQSIMILLPDDRKSEEQAILARLQRGERVDHFRTVRRRKDGQLIDVSLVISPIRDRDGYIVGASKIARDVTALHQAQRQLEEHAADLEAKVHERTARLQDMIAEHEAFSYSLSHDMRAPLRAIQSFTEIVLEDFGAKIPEATEYLHRVISAANRMDRLIQDVLNFARLSRAEIKVAPLDVEKLVRDIVHERPELHPPRAVIAVESPMLPVLGHDASLTQCLTNLLGNAVKFVAPDVTPDVRVFTRAAGNNVRICVRDNGIGISTEGQQRLFSIFHRLNVGRRYEGTGVGLSIVRKAAERMNGSVGVESMEGQGSTFWVELPRAPG